MQEFLEIWPVFVLPLAMILAVGFVLRWLSGHPKNYTPETEEERRWWQANK